VGRVTTSTAVPSTGGPALTLDQARAQFDPVPGYLNAASLGLPPRPVADAVRRGLDDWQAGRATAAGYDAAVTASRALFARLVGVTPDRVAVGSQTSVAAGTVAASLPDGAEVVCVEGDFTSMVFPFLVQADRGVRVRQVPLEGLADAVRAGTDLVAFSLAQSACGSLADADAVVAAARAVGAMTFCDLTQAAGWLPVDAGRYDVTVCSAYKWLCSPRGTAFTTLTAEAAERLRPVTAGWYAGEDVWGSCYGPQMHLAADARRFDVSPAWLCWLGTEAALRLFTDLDVEDVHRHDGRLADALRAGLDLDPCGRPVVSLPDPDGSRLARLTAAGASVAARAGKVRIAFHLWNDEDDVRLALDALR
jgi:selenocysteine lyase/cysteine desulfurase